MKKISKDKASDYKFLGNCPICDSKFSHSHTSQIDKDENMQTLYVECGKCGSSVVLGIIKNIPGVVTTVGMLTDMKREDIDRMKKLSPITYDDVIEVHKYLENY